MTAYKKTEDLKPGDALSTWFGNMTISKFDEYNGPLDFVSKIAVFANGQKMSLEKGHHYKTYTPA